jgi:hypothetical protein
VQRAPGLPCALFLLGRNEFAKLGRTMSRECGVMSAHYIPTVIVRLGWSVRDGVEKSRRTGSPGQAGGTTLSVEQRQRSWRKAGTTMKC